MNPTRLDQLKGEEAPHVMSSTEFTQTRRAVEAMVITGGGVQCSLETALTMADLIATIDHLREVIHGQKRNEQTIRTLQHRNAGLRAELDGMKAAFNV